MTGWFIDRIFSQPVLVRASHSATVAIWWGISTLVETQNKTSQNEEKKYIRLKETRKQKPLQERKKKEIWQHTFFFSLLNICCAHSSLQGHMPWTISYKKILNSIWSMGCIVCENETNENRHGLVISIWAGSPYLLGFVVSKRFRWLGGGFDDMSVRDRFPTALKLLRHVWAKICNKQQTLCFFRCFEIYEYDNLKSTSVKGEEEITNCEAKSVVMPERIRWTDHDLGLEIFEFSCHCDEDDEIGTWSCK